MMADGVVKSSFSRFCYTLHAPIGYYIACNLDDSKLYYWADDESSSVYWILALSENENERDVYNWRMQAMEGKARCKGIDLTSEEVAYIQSLLTDENIEQTRLVTERYLSEKRVRRFGRGELRLDFYLEGDSGKPPVCLNDICSWSFTGDSEMFEQLLSWLLRHFNLQMWEMPGARCWNKCMKDAELCQRVAQALDGGIEQIEDLLWNGKPKQMRLLSELPHRRPFWYTCSDGCFTIRYGDEVVRRCGLFAEPNCVTAFGDQHAFDPYKEFENQ